MARQPRQLRNSGYLHLIVRESERADRPPAGSRDRTQQRRNPEGLKSVKENRPR